MYKKVFSEERLKRYRININDTDDDVIARYLWNIALSATVYQLIAIFEITLRNNIYNSISKNLLPDWLDENNIWLSKISRGSQYNIEQKQIKKAKKQLTKIGKPHTQGQIMSQLTLGFWVNMLRNQYRPDIWNKPRVFEDAFPYCPIKVNRIPAIVLELKKILVLRNRISHHEPIFNHPDGIENIVRNLLKTLSWLSNDMNDVVIKLNHFYKIYNAGYNKYYIKPKHSIYADKIKNYCSLKIQGLFNA